MFFNEDEILTVTEINQNFSKATKLAERNGKVIIFKRNHPVYALIDISQHPLFSLSDDEKIDVAAKRVLNRYRSAFEILAK